MLERARKAEAESTMLKTALKNTTSETKKTLKDMEATVNEATTVSQKAESEYATLKDSVGEMMDAWRREVQELRVEVRRKEEEWATEREEVALKYKSVLKLQQAAKYVHSCGTLFSTVLMTDRTSLERLRLEALKAEKAENQTEFEDRFRRELTNLREQFTCNAQQSSKAEITAE